MPTLPIKTYFPSWAQRVHSQARFLVKHRAAILAVVAIVSPGDLVAVTAGIDGAIALAGLVERIHAIIDPNAPAGE